MVTIPEIAKSSPQYVDALKAAKLGGNKECIELMSRAVERAEAEAKEAEKREEEARAWARAQYEAAEREAREPLLSRGSRLRSSSDGKHDDEEDDEADDEEEGGEGGGVAVGEH